MFHQSGSQATILPGDRNEHFQQVCLQYLWAYESSKVNHVQQITVVKAKYLSLWADATSFKIVCTTPWHVTSGQINVTCYPLFAYFHNYWWCFKRNKATTVVWMNRKSDTARLLWMSNHSILPHMRLPVGLENFSKIAVPYSPGTHISCAPLWSGKSPCIQQTRFLSTRECFKLQKPFPKIQPGQNLFFEHI